MQRLIDANEILKSEHQHYDYMADEYYVLVRDIENAPTVDAEPVVRCDDCIYRDGKTAGQPNILCWQMHVDDFCSYGTRMDERREEEPEINPCRGCEDYDGNGHWVNHISENGATDGIFCSQCGYEIDRDARYNCCPNCGAKMDGERREDA